jgi:hypothetical protein
MSERPFLALIIHMSESTRHGSTDVLSMVSGTLLTVLGGQSPVDVGRFTILVVWVMVVLRMKQASV